MPLDRPPGRSLACARAADASAFFTAFAVWEWIGQESQWDESHLESSWLGAEEGGGGAFVRSISGEREGVKFGTPHRNERYGSVPPREETPPNRLQLSRVHYLLPRTCSRHIRRV